jgi:hypothetical protein
MKKVLLFAVCSWGLLYVNGQIDTVDCNILSFYVSTYGDDAKELAVRDIYETNNIYIDSILISVNSYVPILRDLTAIYHAGLPNITDSIYDIYHIHTFPIPYLGAIFVEVDTNQLWVKNWMAGNLLSGNDTIDGLMNDYSLVRQNFSHYYGFVISTTFPLNVRALADAFKKVKGVSESFEDAVAGGGNDITMNDSIIFREYIFDKAWGDCPSGCIDHHYWKFHVYPGCAVEYIGSSGTPLQLPSSISRTSVENETFSLFPNPASNSLSISVADNLLGSTATITDLTGRKMAAVQLSTVNRQLSTADFASGVYFVTVTASDGRNATKKLVIQK